MNPEIAETTGISEIGISFADDLPFSFVIRIIDFDSFLDGARGMEGVTELSTKISFSSTFDFLEMSSRSSLVLVFFKLVLLVNILSKTHFEQFPVLIV